MQTLQQNLEAKAETNQDQLHPEHIISQNEKQPSENDNTLNENVNLEVANQVDLS